MSAADRPTRGLFVTGTDTGVGKTYVAVRAARDLRRAGLVVGAYKPACSGATTDADGTRRWEDVERLHDALDGVFPRERIGPQCFGAPLAPPVAADREGGAVDEAVLAAGFEWWLGRVDVLLVEGAGGLLCPLTKRATFADLAGEFGLPILVVARAGLGTINHTLLTLEVAERRGLPVAAVLLNRCEPGVDDELAGSNAEEIRRRTVVPVLGPLVYSVDETGDEEIAEPAEEAGKTARIQAPFRGKGGGGDLRGSKGRVRIDWFSLAAPPFPRPASHR